MTEEDWGAFLALIFMVILFIIIALAAVLWEVGKVILVFKVISIFMHKIF